ncbi:MAG TPA: PKD domain-containing protein, partial [Bacteroidales bacterium]|nr:PKD domain-containing protein [Bacteroidales bacterium]
RGRKMKALFLSIYLSLNVILLAGQDCNILSKANNILPDRLCSPLSVNWQVEYTGVNNAGTPVQIRFDWDDGNVDMETANTTGPGLFNFTANHTYVSTGEKCNYRPQATLVVNGVVCSSSTQEQIVTVWDDDNHNGGHMHISPEIYPICFGNGADVRFQDLTQFNCVPPQEEDVPNLYTRWIQWIYGTDNTMTGTPVTINGTPQSFPYYGPVITLPGPVTGSGVYSDIINVANDKNIGQYFQVTLLNWNYCNPYDDPNIPGPPADPVNGDHPPVRTTAIILIVPYPDATITPVDTLCVDSDPVTLHAHDSGGQWSGDGVNGDEFSPYEAGPGDHVINYIITDGNNCSDADQIIITVMPAPSVSIDSVGTVFITDPPVSLSASPPGGTWTGKGVSNGIFYPDSAGTGVHTIIYQSLPDRFGCSGTDSIHINVIMPSVPVADFGPDTTGCSPLVVKFRNNSNPGSSYLWDFGDNTYSTEEEPSHTYYLPGQYTVRLTASNIAGQSTTSHAITVYQSPSAVFTAYPENVTMNNQEVLFTNLSNNATQYIWDFGDGTSSTLENPVHIYDTSGVYPVILEAVTDEGCTDTISDKITVMIIPAPVADFLPDTAGCAPLSVNFRNNSLSGITYLWDFGDQNYSNDFEPDHVYNIPGEYAVKLTVTNNSGQSTLNRLVTVYQNPSALFNVYPTDVFSNTQVVVFTNMSHYGSSYLWNFGDGTFSTEVSPWHKYDTVGVYRVTLIVSTDKGCTDSLTFDSPIRVDFKNGDIKFPNAFRWNQSGPTGGYWNDDYIDDTVFRPFFKNIIDYKLQIFNRWGVLIYESHDLNKGWDGYFRDGNLAGEGVYVYLVTGQYADGTYFKKTGDVTFLH